MNFQQKRLIDLANKCVNFGKYDYVKIILVRLLQNNTNNAEILSEISKLYIRMRKYDKAMAYARRAFELEKSVETLEALANACYVNKNYQDSAIMYEELTKYKKEEIIYYYCQRAYKNLGLEEEGIRVLEDGAKEFKTPALYGTIMFEYLELGRPILASDNPGNSAVAAKFPGRIFLFKSGDPQDFITQAQKLLQ